MVNWNLFPNNVTDAKKLSKEWTKEFIQNPSYSKLLVNIYFHLTGKTIRFELKPFVQNIQILNLSESVYNIIVNETEWVATDVKFFDMSVLEDTFPSLDDSKNLAKEWALHLESMEKYSNYTFVIFFNQNKKTVKVSCYQKK